MAFYDNVRLLRLRPGRGGRGPLDRGAGARAAHGRAGAQAGRAAPGGRRASRLELEDRDLDAELAAFEARDRGPHPRGRCSNPCASRPRRRPSRCRVEAKTGPQGVPRRNKSQPFPTGRFLSSGEVQDKDTYTVTVRATLSGITAFRLEALPDPSLPQKGPGRSLSGAFVVTGIERSKAGAGRVPLARAAADFNEKTADGGHASTATPPRAGASPRTPTWASPTR